MYEMDEETTWICLEEIGSTNDYVKDRRSEKRNITVTAKRQTGGRGTKGRSFSSEEGGVYLSQLKFYENLPAKNAFTIMLTAAVAVCETLRFYGLTSLVKWPNDIHVNRKKICGILIENTFSGDKISSSVVGIGLNVNNPLPDELLNIATTMSKEGGKAYSVEEVTERLLGELSKQRTIEEYRRYFGYAGERVTLLIGDERVPATLLSVSDEGKLRVETATGERLLSSAEVSVRIEE